MSLFRERRYQEALDEFLAAAKLNPASPLAANNVGFAYFKLGRHQDAIAWFQKTVALDATRAVAYANLGDALVAHGDPVGARRAYEKYLQLQPASRLAPSVRQKLAGLSSP
jgi:tetratricopeptide (TPR) repeat protein